MAQDETAASDLADRFRDDLAFWSRTIVSERDAADEADYQIDAAMDVVPAAWPPH